MHVLMLGWEFPPFITGGLGTACYGLTRALDRRGVRVTFVLPRPVDATAASHVDLLSPGVSAGVSAGVAAATPGGVVERRVQSPADRQAAPEAGSLSRSPEFAHVDFIRVPSRLSNPYARPEGEVSEAPSPGASATSAMGSNVAGWTRPRSDAHATPESFLKGESLERLTSTPPGDSDYAGDMFAETARYARFCLAAVLDYDFDVIHAHDWMTYPAGLAISHVTGKPLVVHVHSTEFDRSGEHVNQRIYDIERLGMQGAARVITVSQLTRGMVIARYGVDSNKVEVVYNGVEIEPSQTGMTGIRSEDRIVLYFGRITYQKGPEYFLRAARRVLEVMQDVKFVVAGSGDMARHMIHMAASMGIGHKVLFTGFLRGDDIKRVFALADLYVMPSVSEPFGIAPLEAMSHDVPALISKSSGVSEVLTHALKVDFWDIDDMANKIVAVLRHPPLSQTLRKHGQFEIRRLTWDGAADRCEQVYRAAAAPARAS